jgi:simple sugar transport system ATP-binding protein
MEAPLVELKSVSKYFGSVIALKDVSFDVRPGEVHCLLGDNGAGKSTLIKVLSGVYNPDEGAILVGGTQTRFNSPKDTLDKGIATVYQDLALVPLMSVARNFFLGREP